MSILTSFYVQLCLTYICGVPIFCIAVTFLWKDWRKLYIIKRNKLLTGIAFGCAAISELVLNPLLQAYYLGATDSAFIIGLIAPIVVMFRFIMFYSLIARFWLYYFDTQLIRFNENKDWRMSIDPINEEKNNWFVQNINKYGNEYYILTRIVIFTLIEIMLVFLIAFLIEYYIVSNNNKLNNLSLSLMIKIWYQSISINTIVTLNVPSLISICLFYKTISNFEHNNYNDNFGIRQESILTMILIACYSIYEPFAYVIYSFDVSVEAYLVILSVLETIWTILYILSMYSIGIYPKQLQLQDPNNGNLCFSKMTETIEKMCGGCCVENYNSRRADKELLLLAVPSNIATLHWYDIVHLYDGYEALMKHLEKEFAIENLLFIQEVCHTLQIY